SHRPTGHIPHGPSMNPMRPNMNGVRPNRSFFIQAHSYETRPFLKSLAVKTQYRAPWVPTINRNNPPVNRKFSTGRRNFPIVNRKFPTASRKFTTGSTKIRTADMGRKGKAVKPSACWVLNPSQNLSNKGPINNSVSVMFKKYTYIDTQGRLKTPRQNNMYSINLNNIVPQKDLICWAAKASADECILGHKRLGHLNVKTMNKLVRHNLVRGLPTKSFDNDHTCTACLKRKQHKASWIKREFSNAKIPQQNGVAERRNRTLIEAARTMLIDAKLHVTCWAEAVNTACYVQNRVLVNKSQNKTPYELFNGRTPAIGFLKPFGCHVMILNTLDNLGKFEAKGMKITLLDTQWDEGYFIGYSMSSKTFKVFNKRTKRVKENLHVEFLENKAIEKGAGLNWLFDIDSLTNSMNYVSVVVAGTNSTNFSGTKDAANQEADPMETLAVETPLPTVSSPVLTACFNDSQEPSKPKKIFDALQDPSWVEAMQEELLQFKIQNVWSLVDCPKGEEGIDYDEVFAPVARTEAIRLFLAYASFMGFTIYQMDVKSVFLYGTIDEELCSEFEALMHEKFQMSAMGELNLFLRLQVLEKEDGISLSQGKYVGDILKKFGYSNVRSSNTPMDKENPWGKEGTGKDVDLYLYRSMIGSLMYLTASRPGIMFAVCACARHQVTPKECHLNAVKRIFRYLKGHPKLGLWYPKESPFDLVAYSDSDYGDATQDHKSTTRGCQFLGRRLISWQCKKKTIVATSTTEEEYVAAASCCGQVLWIQNQLLDYGLSMPCEALSKEISSSVLCFLRLIPLCLSPKSTGFNEFSSNIATALVCLATNRVYNFSKMIFDGMGEGSGTPTESHHTPTFEASQSSQHELPSPSLPPVTTATIPHVIPTSQLLTVIPTDTTPLRHYTRRARIAYDSTPRVTSLAADEGSMQQNLNELTALCTNLQRQQSEMVSRFEAQELEINRLKARIKLLKDKDRGVIEKSGDDAPIKGRRLDEGEEAAERVSDDTEEMATVLTSMDATSILTSGGVQVVPTAVEVATASVSILTGSRVVSTASPIIPTGKFSKWKKQMLCYLARMEPYYLKYIKDGPFRPKIADGDAKPKS
nr:uncharacterized mitochondrial protein AtMg00810-like [Tanacetum cinerariifolium]